MMLGPNSLAGTLRFGFQPRGIAPPLTHEVARYVFVGNTLAQTLRFGFVPQGNAPVPPVTSVARNLQFLVTLGKLKSF